MPKTAQEEFGALYPLIPRLVELGKQQRRISRMKQTHLKLEEKNRLLMRKISEYNRQGE
jgi:hypothetical protein